MHPDLFGGLWVIKTLFIWWWPGRPLPPPLEPGIEWSMDHNPSVVNSVGGIKLLAWCESLPVYQVYLCHPTKCGPVTFLASLDGLHKEAVTSDQLVYIIFCQGFCTYKEWPYLEFQFTTTNFMSMAAKSSNLGDKTSEANLQVDGQAEKPAQGAADWQEMEEKDGSPPNSLTWSPVQRLLLGCLNTKHCLEIRVTLTDELGDVHPPPHAWTAPVVEDMLWEARAGLTEAVVIGPGRATLFYGRRSMGEGLKADEARDAAFLLTGAGMWVGKLAYLTANPMAIQEGRRAIAQAILDNRVKVRGLGHPWVNQLAQQPFKFNTPRTSPPGDVFIHCGSYDKQPPQRPSRGCGHSRRWRDQWPQSPWFPSPSPDCGFESDRSSISTASLMSSQLDHSDRSRCSRWGRRHREGKHLMLWIKSCFRWGWLIRETVSDWGVHLSRHLQILAVSLLDHFPQDHVAELKRDHFYGGLPKWLKAMVAYLKVGPQVRMYSDYLRAAREAEKEDSIKLSRSSRSQPTDGPSKPRTTSFFPLRKLKGSQPFPKKPAVWLAQLDEEDAGDGKDPDSDDPDRIKGVTKDFMVSLARGSEGCSDIWKALLPLQQLQTLYS